LTERPLVWITGARGLIGNELVRSAPECAPQLNARGLTRQAVDLLDEQAVAGLFARERPGLIIHCAAVSRNPICEAEPKLAHRTNVGVTKLLVELAADIPFLFFSTDLVFDGTKGGYVEEDAPNPLSVYAETKVLAEEAVRKHSQHIIARISLTGGKSPTGDRGFNEEMKNAWRAGKTLSLFIDEYRCPGSADVIARAVWELASKNARGTFHLCFAERLSRYDIGHALAAKHPELNPRIIAGSRKEYTGPPRPADTSMNCAKVRLLSFQLPRFREWLAADQTGF
jgi:dTDP-4-dehydrorhamnose reductase